MYVHRCMHAAPIGTKDSSEAELLAINKVLQLSAAEDSMFWASKFLSNQIQQLLSFGSETRSGDLRKWR
ncbi:hypothetical protein NC652_022744 [Populus alba x Populus x berolinensis]|nr:hypothetical protein NC652_022744 [Populus alba x Populus x berolinensis]